MVKNFIESIFCLKLVPSIFVGIVCCISFYSFYFFKVPVGLVLLLVVSFFIFGLVFKSKRKIFIFITVGFLVTFIALMRYKFFISPIKSLLPPHKIKSITVELTGEPKPASRYYAISCKLISVHDHDDNTFSAKGNAKIFFPKSVINQNLSGGISLIASNEDQDDCKIFASGVILKANAKYVKGNSSEDCFFSTIKIPHFIGWSSPLQKFRGTLRFNLMRLLFSWGAAGALLMALICADKNFLGADVNTAFINCGLAHVLALSGMHVSIVSGASEKISNRVFSKKLTRIICLISILIFVWFAGSAPSLNRALGMAAISIFASLLNIRISVLSGMCVMFICHLFLKPQETTTLSFMLSYGALAGILIFGNALKTIGEGKVPESILSSFTASFGAQAFTFPIIAFTIKSISLIGLLSSSIISPLIGYFLILGLAFIFVSSIFVELAYFLGTILNYFYNFIMLFVNSLTGIFSFVIEDTFTAIIYVIVPIFLGIVCIYFQNRIKIRRKNFAKSTI